MNEISLNRLVFLNETGFNLHTSQSYGYLPKNTKAFINVKANKGINQSLMYAIDIHGVIGYDIVSEAYNGDRFKKFITEKLFPYFEEHKYKVLYLLIKSFIFPNNPVIITKL